MSLFPYQVTEYTFIDLELISTVLLIYSVLIEV